MPATETKKENKKLRDQMESLGLSVTALAEIMGVHRTHVYRWLDFRSELPKSAETLLALAVADKPRGVRKRILTGDHD